MPNLSAVDESVFHPLYYDLFWQFIAERQAVWYRRSVLKIPGPWTGDRIMNSEFITNIYREIDPGTEYVLNSILETSETPIDKIFNIIMYRLMGSQTGTHELLGFQRISAARSKQADKAAGATKWDPERFVTVLREASAEGHLVFGDSYRVAPYQDEGGADKIENVSRLLDRIAGNMPELLQGMRAATNSRALWEVLFSIRGIGEFLAFQIMVDTLYPVEMQNGQPLFPFTLNDWAIPGPGAKNGIKRLLKPGITPSSHLEVMEWLRDQMPYELERLELPFVYLATPSGTSKRLHTADIQSCLCEFFKYSRIWAGEARLVRRFSMQTPSEALKDYPVVIEGPASKVESIGDIMVGALTPKMPSAAEHERLVSVALGGGVLLDGVGGNAQPPVPGFGQLPADYAAQLAQTGLVGVPGQGVSFDHNQMRTVLIDPWKQHGGDLPYAVLIIPIPHGSAGVAPVPQPAPVNPPLGPADDADSSGAGEAQVQSDDSE